MNGLAIKSGVVGLVTEAFRHLPDVLVILLAMVVLLFGAGLMLMWSWAQPL